LAARKQSAILIFVHGFTIIYREAAFGMTRNTTLFLILALVLAACGTVATPEFAASVQETRIAEAATAAAETAAAPTLPPTETPTEEPTATVVPPTETEAATEAPTDAPTDEPTEAATEASTEAPTDAPTEATATSGETAADGPSGDAANGEVLFTTFQASVNFACNTCHLVNAEAQLIGPGLLNISTRAAERVPGQSAEEYLHNSILHPSEFVVPGFPDMLMPQTYGDIFTDEEINDLVAYLFTLNG
jgi:cytochrome c2